VQASWILTGESKVYRPERGAYGLPTPTGADVSAPIKGLFYGGGMGQLTAQAIGSGAITGATLIVAFILMYAVKATGTLRVSREGELEGLDIHEHGMFAYPEFATHPSEPLHGSPSQASSMAPAPVPAKARV